MKTYKKCLVGLVTFLMSMNSCDTRDDYFLEYGSGPIITVGTAEGDTTVYTEDMRYRNVLLHWGETKTIDFALEDYYGSEFTYKIEVKIPRLYNNLSNGITDSYYLKKTGDVEYDGLGYYTLEDFDNIEITIESEQMADGETKGVLSFKETTKNGIVDYLNGAYSDSEDVYWSLLNTADVRELIVVLTATNHFGVENYFNFFVDICQNSQPVADLRVSKLDGDSWDYSISASGSDADDDDIVMYEYLFDGKTKEPENKIKYYSVYKDVNNQWVNASSKDFYLEETALSGELIVPTKLSTVKHSFNKTGTHNVAVRCLDARGCWSEWVKETIEIK